MNGSRAATTRAGRPGWSTGRGGRRSGRFSSKCATSPGSRSAMGANEAERERWNDQRRYEVWPKREQLAKDVTAYLLDTLAPRAGERIVDLGSGGGRSTFAAAAAVGPGGE